MLALPMMSYIAFSVSTERKASVSQTNPPAVAAPGPPPLALHTWNDHAFAVEHTFDDALRSP